MSKPSLFRQVDARIVEAKNLKKSPRHWNASLLDFDGRLWLAYRYHRQTHDSRCGIAISELDRKTLKPKPAGQHLDLDGGEEGSHHEDPRFFMFRGEPHISYTEMTGYQPGVDYSCLMKYAKLRFSRGKWSATQIWRPVYGRNSGMEREKNWVFFESGKELHCVYQDSPNRVVLKLNGAEVVQEWTHPAAYWPWGEIRGGTPPVVTPGGKLLAMFHSSLATEVVPHHVRYYAGAYMMEPVAPFRITEISQRPVMAGSESDGHRVDPRYVAGWKPFVVFPCGIVPRGDNWLVSLGVNDWCSALANLGAAQLQLGPPDGSAFVDRFFKVPNGTIGVRLSDETGRLNLVEWSVPRSGRVGMAGEGYLRVSNPRHAEEVFSAKGVVEITQREFELAHHVRNSSFVHG